MKRVKLSNTDYVFGEKLKIDTTLGGDVLVGDFPGSIIQARLIAGTVSLFFLYDKAGAPLTVLHVGGSATFAINEIVPYRACFYSAKDGLHITNNLNSQTMLLKIL